MSHLNTAKTLMTFCIGIGAFVFVDQAINSLSHKVSVTATAYTSHPNQTDSTPFEPACGGDLRDGQRAIAVSRDLMRNGLKCGVRVSVNGEKFVVRDVMNKRFSNRIDIYHGRNLRAARQFGKRTVQLAWGG